MCSCVCREKCFTSGDSRAHKCLHAHLWWVCSAHGRAVSPCSHMRAHVCTHEHVDCSGGRCPARHVRERLRPSSSLQSRLRTPGLWACTWGPVGARAPRGSRPSWRPAGPDCWWTGSVVSESIGSGPGGARWGLRVLGGVVEGWVPGPRSSPILEAQKQSWADLGAVKQSRFSVIPPQLILRGHKWTLDFGAGPSVGVDVRCLSCEPYTHLLGRCSEHCRPGLKHRC